MQGMILLSELSRRRIRSINKLVRVNRTEIVMVIRVDKEKGSLNIAKVLAFINFSLQATSIFRKDELILRTSSSVKNVTTKRKPFTVS